MTSLSSWQNRDTQGSNRDIPARTSESGPCPLVELDARLVLGSHKQETNCLTSKTVADYLIISLAYRKDVYKSKCCSDVGKYATVLIQVRSPSKLHGYVSFCYVAMRLQVNL